MRACTCVGKVRKDINWTKSVRHTCQTERSRLTVNANISLIFAGLPLNGTDSNNCKHLGNLQALHVDPRGSSPGTGGPAQHKSRSACGDYLLSPWRDMGTGILSDSFTLIIRTGWQHGASVDSYRKCFLKNMTVESKKKNFTKVAGKHGTWGHQCAPFLECHQFFSACVQQTQTIWPKSGAPRNCRSVCAH